MATSRRRYFVTAMLVLVAGYTRAFAADECEVNFGDKLYDWVSKDAHRQATSLAKADFAARFTNSRILEYDQLRAELASVSTDLDGQADEFRSHADEGIPTLTAAVAAQDRSGKALDTLGRQSARLDRISRRLEILSEPPSREQFIGAGAQHVGRSTLLESIVELGNREGRTLNARFSRVIRVKFDDGKAIDANGVAPGNNESAGADGIAWGMVHSDSQWANAFAFVYLTVKGFVEYEKTRQCEEKIKEQRGRAARASTLLTSVLPTEDDLFALFASAQLAAQARFLTVQSRFSQDRAILEARWKNLMAIALANANVASKTLTAEKVELLGRAYGTADPLAKLFDEVALTQLVQSVQQVQSAALQSEVALKVQCRDSLGIQAAEDLMDTRQEGAAQLAELSKAAKIAPVKATLASARERLETPVPAVQSLLTGGPGSACFERKSALHEPYHVSLSPPNPLQTGRMVQTRHLLRVSSPDLASFQPVALLAATDFGGTSTAVSVVARYDGNWPGCLIYRDGSAYGCGRPGPGQVGLGAGFPGTGDSPYRDVTSGASDGGFARDSRRHSQNIDTAKSNIDLRITDLAKQQAAIEVVVPEWLNSTQVGMGTLIQSHELVIDVENTLRERIFSTLGGALQDAEQRLVQFTKEPRNDQILGELIRQSGAVDTTLPDLPADRVMPEGPKIPGMHQDDRAYPTERTRLERQLRREDRKGEKIKNVELRRQHRRLITTARMFAAAQSPKARRIAAALILDAASIRYADAGWLSAPQVTFIDNAGNLFTRSLNQTRPSGSLADRIADFDNQLGVIKQQQSLAAQALSRGGDFVDARQRALGESVLLREDAEQAFYNGDLLEAEALLEVTKITLDLVTAFTPGISWARDVYETISGADLISGEVLKPWERTAVALGAITAGTVSKGPRILRAIASLEKTGMLEKKIQHILHSAQTINRRVVAVSTSYSPEAAERARRALDHGSRFWDAEKETLVFVENNVRRGKTRTMVAVNIEKMSATPIGETRLSDSKIKRLFKPSTAKPTYIHLPGD